MISDTKGSVTAKYYKTACQNLVLLRRLIGTMSDRQTSIKPNIDFNMFYFLPLLYQTFLRYLITFLNILYRLLFISFIIITIFLDKGQ